VQQEPELVDHQARATHSEMARVLHLKITNVVLTSPEQFARENQQRVQRYRE
jgi:hypothetical protein